MKQQLNKEVGKKVWQGLEVDPDLIDATARLEAINPTQSFIVQAPAGSGKTALLTQRFLALLSVVEKPEQIVAMTFTKKAAAEMRERIFENLQLALKPLDKQASLFERNVWLLSQAALEQNQRQNWQLLNNPNRLRIRTIDSMNGYLVQQMPFLSRLGSPPKMAEQNDELYRQAVREAFKNPMVAEAVGELLRLVNGRYHKAENLVVMMLQKRDQWMKHLTAVGDEDGRAFLEMSLAELVEQERQRAISLLGNRFDIFNQAVRLSDYAYQNGYEVIQPLIGINFSVDQTDLLAWQALANWLLTTSGSLHKTINKGKGFPTGKGEAKDIKDQFIGLLSDCRVASNFDDFEQGLQILKSLPEPHYSDTQWQSLSHLIALLKLSVAHLKLVFQQASQADFIEISQAASLALGSEIEPTDLAERLDYQLKHLLIDEFQDTSISQFDLVKKLTATWIDNDGRSLFIVGDPMQSIYRFREAEVGNFLTVWRGVLGAIKIKPLNLAVNFRSEKGVVDWVNQIFQQILPSQSDLQKGAVSYTASQSLSQSESVGIVTRWALNQPAEDSLEQIMADINSLISSPDFSQQQQTIGILGRSRSHLMPIALELKSTGIAFRAIELEALTERQEIQDAVALSRALLHLGDRPAWVALLRSPLIGLSLAELYELLGENADFFQTPVWSSLEKNKLKNNPAWIEEKISILQTSLSHLGDQPFSQLVRETWLKLDAAQTLSDPIALDNMDAYWQFLASFDGSNLNVQILETALKKLYATADSSAESAQIELMTIHKSKGLEFDFVLLPSLGKLPRNDDSALVSWLDFSTFEGQRLVLSPLHRRGDNSSALTKLIKQFEQEKQAYESTRLLYVAITRAKIQCYLYGTVKFNEQDEDLTLKVAKKSLLACLWSAVITDFESLIDSYKSPVITSKPPLLIPKISRLPSKRPKFIEQFIQANCCVDDEDVTEITEELGIKSLQIESLVTGVGNLFHAILESAVQASLDNWSWEVIQHRMLAYENWLLQNGMSETELPTAISRLLVSLKHALHNDKLRWSLLATHQESRTELELTSILPEDTEYDSKIVTRNHIVDRSFIDEQGVRWIIDYKTSFFEGDLAAKQVFIQQQTELYLPQLKRYGTLFNAQESRPQKWVLYFSYLDAWVELN